MSDPKQIDFTKGEVLLVNKPLTWTSFDVTNKIKYLLLKKMHRELGEPQGKKHKIKVGHAGTLDPLATGLLIVCIGPETKNIDQYMGQEKEYTGSFFVGATTPSFDKETEVDNTFETAHFTESLLQETTKKFIGNIAQIPPIYSAIKKDGVRAYKSARAGEELVLEPRQVEIKLFEITKIEMPLVYFKIVCSKGTYIRAIARDFGSAINSGAYLNSLCRTRIGNFNIKDAHEIEALQIAFAE